MLVPTAILLLSALASAKVVPRQTMTTSAALASLTPITGSYELFPTGYRDTKGRWESTLPLECMVGCWVVMANYEFCFIFQGQLRPEFTLSPEECNDFHCDAVNFDHLVQCLNCVVANGGERPYGPQSADFNISTAIPDDTGSSAFGIPVNPEGYLDEDQARGWVTNITDRCSSISRPFTSPVGLTEITATPTATEFYSTTWTEGATVIVTPFPGLASYTDVNFAKSFWASARPTTSGASNQPTASVASSQPAAAGASATPSSAAFRDEVPKLAALGAGSVAGALAWLLL